MADYFLDDEAQELFREFRIEVGILGQFAQAGDLAFFSAWITGRQGFFGLIGTHCLGNAKAFGQNMDQSGIDIINRRAEAGEHGIGLVFGHIRPASMTFRARPLPALHLQTAQCRFKGGLMSADIIPLRPRDSQPSLNPIMALTAQGMNSVNQVILERMQSEIPLIPALAGHLIAGGGKRMRPMLTLAGAALCDYHGTRHHKLAAAVEFIHTATLLHDDVVDGSEMRRGKAAANLIFGNPATVLVGDFLFTRSFELMVEDGSLKVLKILSNASSVISEGEVDQLTAARQVETTEERYLNIIGSKTAALFAAATRIAAVVAEKSEAEERALEDYGRNLGIAFQLVDDAMDYDSDSAEMGKGRGDDFREGKMTLPVILAYARGTEGERAFWKAAIQGHRTSDADLAHAIELIARHDAVNETRERARHFAARAINAIAIFPPSEARAAMSEAAEFAVARRT